MMEEEQQLFHPDEETVVWPDKVDISQLCRICANSSEYLIPIFDGEGMENELELKIKKHLPIKISKEDPLPMSLCYQCASTLIAWHDLTLGCIEADKRLRDLADFKEERSSQSKMYEGDGLESIRGVSDIEIEFEEEVTTTPSTSAQVEFLDESDTPEKGNKRCVLKPLVKEESEQKQNQVTEDETEGNTSVIESTSDERCPIMSKVTHNAQIFDSKTPATAEYNNICVVQGQSTVKQFININSTDKDKSTVQKNMYSCKYCNKTFKFLTQYQKHIKEHKNSSTNDLESESEDDIFSEVELELGDNQELFLCQDCGKGFKGEELYKLHLRKHNANKPFVCHLCGKGFLRCTSLSHHLKYIHLGIKDHICEICGRTFGMKSQLESHQKSHTEERPYVCHFCGKSFKTTSTLYTHCQTHTNDFPFQCPYCDHQFRKKARLFDHITIHTKEKNHECDICGRRFGAKIDLYRHKKTHSGTKPFKCPECNYMFGQKRYLRVHMKAQHKIQYQETN